MLEKIILTMSMLTLMTGQLLADHHEGEPPPDMPQAMLMPPPGTVPPEDAGEPPPDDPEAAKAWLISHFYPMMDTDGDELLSETELLAWVAWVHIPMMPPEGEPPPDGEPPPEGEPGAPCGDFIGNHIQLDISIDPGPNAAAITVPEGREVGCFFLEVTEDLETMGNEFRIIEETDPPTDPPPVVWHSIDDGPAAYEALVLGPGIYHVELLMADIPTAVFSVSFVDYPTGP